MADVKDETTSASFDVEEQERLAGLRADTEDKKRIAKAKQNAAIRKREAPLLQAEGVAQGLEGAELTAFVRQGLQRLFDDNSRRLDALFESGERRKRDRIQRGLRAQKQRAAEFMQAQEQEEQSALEETVRDVSATQSQEQQDPQKVLTDAICEVLTAEDPIPLLMGHLIRLRRAELYQPTQAALQELDGVFDFQLRLQKLRALLEQGTIPADLFRALGQAALRDRRKMVEMLAVYGSSHLQQLQREHEAKGGQIPEAILRQFKEEMAQKFTLEAERIRTTAGAMVEAEKEVARSAMYALPQVLRNAIRAEYLGSWALNMATTVRPAAERQEIDVGSFGIENLIQAVELYYGWPDAMRLRDAAILYHDLCVTRGTQRYRVVNVVINENPLFNIENQRNLCWRMREHLRQTGHVVPRDRTAREHLARVLRVETFLLRRGYNLLKEEISKARREWDEEAEFIGRAVEINAVSQYAAEELSSERYRGPALDATVDGERALRTALIGISEIAGRYDRDREHAARLRAHGEVTADMRQEFLAMSAGVNRATTKRLQNLHAELERERLEQERREERAIRQREMLRLEAAVGGRSRWIVHTMVRRAVDDLVAQNNRLLLYAFVEREREERRKIRQEARASLIRISGELHHQFRLGREERQEEIGNGLGQRLVSEMDTLTDLCRQAIWWDGRQKASREEHKADSVLDDTPRQPFSISLGEEWRYTPQAFSHLVARTKREIEQAVFRLRRERGDAVASEEARLTQKLHYLTAILNPLGGYSEKERIRIAVIAGAIGGDEYRGFVAFTELAAIATEQQAREHGAYAEELVQLSRLVSRRKSIERKISGARAKEASLIEIACSMQGEKLSRRSRRNRNKGRR